MALIFYGYYKKSGTTFIAGIAAKGITRVKKLEYILRGYEGLDKKLNLLGANIIREEGE